MTEERSEERGFDRGDETMARLLRLAGPRAPVPRDIEARVYDRVRKEWRAATGEPDADRVYAQVRRQWTREKRRGSWFGRWALPAAMAAAAVMAIAVVMQPAPPVPANVAVGTVARVSGGGLPLRPGQQVFPGERLETGADQGLSLILGNAESLRVDEGTVLVVETQDRFRLVQGRVYADTGDFMYRERALVIDTSLGAVTDVGTQFSVAAGGDRLDVAVREGRVDVTQEQAQFTAVAGDRMLLKGAADAEYERLEPHDPYWDWAASLAPAFDIENKSLLDFLRWAARETGRTLEFADENLRIDAMRTDLHGSVADFEPLQAIESVLATTRFSYRIETDRILIER